MLDAFENPATKRNKIKYNGDHFCKACQNLQRFCDTLFDDFYNRKKGLFKNI